MKTINTTRITGGIAACLLFLLSLPLYALSHFAAKLGDGPPHYPPAIFDMICISLPVYFALTAFFMFVNARRQIIAVFGLISLLLVVPAIISALAGKNWIIAGVLIVFPLLWLLRYIHSTDIVPGTLETKDVLKKYEI